MFDIVEGNYLSRTILYFPLVFLFLQFLKILSLASLPLRVFVVALVLVYPHHRPIELVEFLNLLEVGVENTLTLTAMLSLQLAQTVRDNLSTESLDVCLAAIR